MKKLSTQKTRKILLATIKLSSDVDPIQALKIDFFEAKLPGAKCRHQPYQSFEAADRAIEKNKSQLFNHDLSQKQQAYGHYLEGIAQYTCGNHELAKQAFVDAIDCNYSRSNSFHIKLHMWTGIVLAELGYSNDATYHLNMAKKYSIESNKLLEQAIASCEKDSTDCWFPHPEGNNDTNALYVMGSTLAGEE